MQLKHCRRGCVCHRICTYMWPIHRVGILAHLRVMDLIFFSLDAQVSTYAYHHYASTWTRMYGRACIHNGLKISHGKSLKMSHFSTKLSKYRVTCFKLARELANCSKLNPIISDLSQDLLKRVFSHHWHDIDKVVAQCLLAGNYPNWSHRQKDIGVESFKIGIDPLKWVFYTFKGSKRPLLFGIQC